MNYDELYQKMKKYADENGYKLNPNEKERDALLKALLANEKEHGEIYCPCRRVTGDKEKDKKIICPCAYHKEEIARDGRCFCGLFVRG
ncbi:MAG: ferredoxin:thioredoxin reductase [Candidatus Diapherotrites archaeon]|nr:ferredoxin:thioredoxin reductase [Candidatus Diapherotrites archaeon]